MEHAIKSILEEHGIEDEKLANALADIFALFLQEVDKDQANKFDLENYMRGNR